MVVDVAAGAGLVPGSKGGRFGAHVLDEIILFFGLVLALSPLTFLFFAGDEWGGLVAFFLFLVAFGLIALFGRTAYYSWFHATRGYTPGKKAFGLRLVSIQTGDRPSARLCLLRQFVLIAPMLVLALVALAGVSADGGTFQTLGLAADALLFGVVLLHQQGRGIHDLVAGTMVVKANEIITPEPGMPAVGGGW